MLTLFNSLSKKKEVFKPLTSNQVSMYVCGVTVYDHCHLGHARCMIVFDMMANYFRHLGYQLKWVRNITDVDDKIIKKAIENGMGFEEVSTTFTKSMQEDSTLLGLNPPDVEPKATSHIDDMIDMIKILIEKKFAYLADNGDVCFSVHDFPNYGKLSRQDLNQLLSGVRIDVNDGKRSTADFVLWKQSKPGEPSWPSPWGEGRPGWHIECSAMARAHLGEQIDIHGGGLDLQFPHHENEIAQSEACHGKQFANYWLHVGLLQINNEKMAKSTGNFLTIKDALKRYHPEVIKLFFMGSHYRSPLNLSEESLQQAHKSLQRIYQTFKTNSSMELSSVYDKDWTHRFEQAMNDDFNTAQALAVLFDLNTQINKTPTAILLSTLHYLGGVLGLIKSDPNTFLQLSFESSGLTEEQIAQCILDRKQARLDKQFSKADEIRMYLKEQGIELEDTPAGTSWRRIV